MKIIKINIALLLVLIVGSKQANAQIDPHFSQYYAYPLLLNPALTGVVDGDYRIGLNAKQQWGNVNSGYLTGAASFDMAPVKQLAFGATVINQNAGDLDFNYLNALASASYRLVVGNKGSSILNFGLQLGLINKSFDSSKLRLGSQFDPSSGYNPGFPLNENFSSSNSLMPDVNAGFMFFDGALDKKINVFFGGSVGHLNRPVDDFLGESVHIPMKFTGHGGARYTLNRNLSITPNALYMRQGTAHEISAGAYAEMMLNAQANLLFGANYRMDDAAVAYFGLNIKNMVIGLSYDVNTSSLNQATNYNGGLELSLTFTSRKQLIGPNFFCPRL